MWQSQCMLAFSVFPRHLFWERLTFVQGKTILRPHTDCSSTTESQKPPALKCIQLRSH